MKNSLTPHLSRPARQLLLALRAAQWIDLHPDAPASLRAPIDRAIRDAFYVDTELWKGMIRGQARTCILQATLALSG